MRAQQVLLLCVAIFAGLSGCAHKQHAKVPMKQNVNITFKGTHDGQCKVADVLVDAKGGYVVVCK